jgi:hypothetical protein
LCVGAELTSCSHALGQAALLADYEAMAANAALMKKTVRWTNERPDF